MIIILNNEDDEQEKKKKRSFCASCCSCLPPRTRRVLYCVAMWVCPLLAMDSYEGIMYTLAIDVVADTFEAGIYVMRSRANRKKNAQAQNGLTGNGVDSDHGSIRRLSSDASSTAENSIPRELIVGKDIPTWWESRAALPCPHDMVSSSALSSNANNITVYSPTWHGNPHTIVERMVYVAAYAHEHGFTYGGNIPRERDPTWPQKNEEYVNMIDAVGLNGVLTFGLPEQGNPDHLNVDWSKCIKGKVNITNSFRSHLLSNQVGLMVGDDDMVEYPRSVVVHVRRGKVQPCTSHKLRRRYTPNSYYLDLLEEYVDGQEVYNDAEVIIYSDSDSFEGFEAFRERGYVVRLDAAVDEVWEAMISADLLVLGSVTPYSFLPALLNPNTVLYDNLGSGGSPIANLHRWMAADPKIREASLDSRDLLVSERCVDWIWHHPEHDPNHNSDDDNNNKSIE